MATVSAVIFIHKRDQIHIQGYIYIGRHDKRSMHTLHNKGNLAALLTILFVLSCLCPTNSAPFIVTFRLVIPDDIIYTTEIIKSNIASHFAEMQIEEHNITITPPPHDRVFFGAT